MNNRKIVLNPEYLLKNDIKRIILAFKEGSKQKSFIHPLHGMILSFFDNPLDFNSNCDIICKKLQLNKEILLNFIEKLINNQEDINIGNSQFFKNILIEEPQNYQPRNYYFRNFIIDTETLDFNTLRNYLPSDIVFVINMDCYTNCTYCYADRKTNFSPLSTEKILNILDDAEKIKINSINFSGGEFFLQRDWEIILEKIIDCKFKPIIPTKIPIDNKIVKKIKATGLDRIQISLDSLNEKVLCSTLHVNSDYLNKIHQTIKYLNEADIKFRVNSVITSYNCDIQQFDNLINYLLKFDNFTEISIGLVGYSLFKTKNENNQMRPNEKDVESLYNYLQHNYNNNKKIQLSETLIDDKSHRLNYEKFCDKAYCSGNIDGFVILPDGKVTICEELYWHPKFIVGDLTYQSISEMWNSATAKNLFDNILEESHQICQNCKIKTDCHKFSKKCYKEIIKGFDFENWNFPDPKCPQSPELTNNFYYFKK